jgi:hypothetical protein
MEKLKKNYLPKFRKINEVLFDLKQQITIFLLQN